MKNPGIRLLLLLVTCCHAYAQHTLTLKPLGNMGANAMIWTIYPDSNLVCWPEIKMNAWTWNGEPGLERSLLYFNLTLLPANSVILTAKLSLYGNMGVPEDNSTASGPNNCFIQRTNSAWDPAIVTWDNQPSTDAVHEIMLPASTSPYEDYLNLDITSLVLDLYNNPGLYKGLMLRLDTESQLRRMVFKSACQPDSARSPVLTIIYQDPGFRIINDTNAVSICQGQSYFAGGAFQTLPGIYFDTTRNGKISDSVKVTVLTVVDRINANLGNDTTICQGDALVLYPGKFDTYHWQDGSAQSHYTAESGGVYSVDVTNVCGPSRAEITVTEKSCKIWFPSAFTPNQDGLNDVFKAIIAAAPEEYYLVVYNRWGEKVFETSDYQKGWDGTCKGKPAGPDTFIWLCNYKSSASSRKIVLNGTVILVR